MIFSIPVCDCLLLFLFGGLGVNIHGCGDVCGSYNIFRVVFPLIPSHLFLPPVSPFLYIGSLSSLCQLLLYNTNQLVKNRPDITMQEIIEALHLTVSNETVRKTVRQLGYRRKKKSLHASDQERPRCGREKEKLERPYIWIQSK